MDTTAINITFDKRGYCSFCESFLLKVKENTSYKFNSDSLLKFVTKIKKNGHGKDYDCIIGISGGVDSSWALVKAVELGLRPLAVHMDNGWNSELAQNNISNLITKLNVDLYTHVIEWDEYRMLMQSFFDADVVDVELLYDNAMRAVNWRMASKFKLKYILSGVNTATEGMNMPRDWNWNKCDVRNIKAIARRFTNTKIKTFPAVGTVKYFLHLLTGKRWVPFLDYFEYNKTNVTNELIKSYNYKPYPYKHYESVFTRFYQGYILPKKFNIDKRRLHLSNLIVSGQLEREDAIRQLSKIPYPSEEELKIDMEYFLKKMNWNQEQLDYYIARPPVRHDEYPTEKNLIVLIKIMNRLIRMYERKSS
jgi:N-acetyl sugar amidotransferase